MKFGIQCRTQNEVGPAKLFHTTDESLNKCALSADETSELKGF